MCLSMNLNFCIYIGFHYPLLFSSAVLIVIICMYEVCTALLIALSVMPCFCISSRFYLLSCHYKGQDGYMVP